MPSATDFLNEPQSPSASAFLGEGAPELPLQVSSPEASPDGGLRGRISDFLFSPEGAQTTREAIQGAVESVPQMAEQTGKAAYDALKLRLAGPDERAQILADAIRESLGQGQQTAEDIQAPFGTREWLRGAGQLGMMAAPGLEIARELRTPEIGIPSGAQATTDQPPPQAPASEVPITPPVEQPPPDWYAPRQPEKIQPPLPPPVVPPPPIGTPLQGNPLVGPGPTAANLALQQAIPVASTQEMPPSPMYSPEWSATQPPPAPPVQVPPVVPPIQVPPEIGARHEALRNLYGDVIQHGEGQGPKAMVAKGRVDLVSGAQDPYAIASRVQAGEGTSPAENGVLIAEHERLANEAVRAEEVAQRVPTPENQAAYNELRQRAEDFAVNVLKPAATRAGDNLRIWQAVSPPDLTTETGMREAMRLNVDRELSENEKSEARRIAKQTKDAVNGANDAEQNFYRKLDRATTRSPRVPTKQEIGKLFSDLGQIVCD